jgi:hypothetical protein
MSADAHPAVITKQDNETATRLLLCSGLSCRGFSAAVAVPCLTLLIMSHDRLLTVLVKCVALQH